MQIKRCKLACSPATAPEKGACSVAHLTEGLPQNAGKTLPVKGIGTNGTVRVDLIDRWLRHLYKN
jgi:hypothetical protein